MKRIRKSAVFSVIVVMLLLMTSSMAIIGSLGASATGEASTTLPTPIYPSTGAPAPMSSRVFNTTEHMGVANNPPTIDGALSPGEWDDAAAYDISTTNKNVTMFIMFDDHKIYVAVDAQADITEDKDEPTGSNLIEPNGDYLAISIDGENDGKITYQSIVQGSNDWPSEWPYTGVNGGGDCVDRGAITHGGVNRTAGWWEVNSAGTANTLYIWSPGDGPNMGTGEPYDYINPGFSGHRTYEYSIPYTGIGDSLNRSIGDKIGLVVLVNDGQGPMASTLIGRMPANATSISGPPYQEFMLNGKPKAVMANVPEKLIYVGETLNFDASGSSEPENEGLTYGWDFDYDGVTFDNDSTTVTTSHSYDVSGTYTVALRVSDPHLANDMKTVDIEVVDPEYAPELSNITPSSDPTIAEGDSIDLSVDYNDPNLDHIYERLYINWSIDDVMVKEENTTSSGSTHYTIDTDYTGNFSKGTYAIKVTINDTYDAKGKFTGGSQKASAEWTLTVTDVNRAPTIDSFDPPTASTIMTDEVNEVTFSITKSDPDDDPISVTWYLDGAQTASGTDRYTYVPDYDASGGHSVKVVIEDSGSPPLSDELLWNIIVDDVNRIPLLSIVKPTDSRIKLQEGGSESFEVIGTDPDNDVLLFSWYLDDDLIDDADTAMFDFVTDYDMGRTEGYKLMVVMTDGLETLQHEWTIDVTDVDRIPSIMIVSPKEGDHYTISQLISLDASGTLDPDSDVLTFEWNTGDGRTRNQMKASHMYQIYGAQMISLTVSSDHDGEVRSFERTINITVDAAELEVESITTDKGKVDKDGTVMIKVAIKNTGTIGAQDVTVKLYRNGNLLVDTVRDLTIGSGASMEIEFEWKANDAGDHYFNAKMETGKDTLVNDNDIRSETMTVEKPATNVLGGKGGDLTLLILLMVIIVIIVILGTIVSARRRARIKQELKDAKERARLDEEDRLRIEAEAQVAREELEAQHAKGHKGDQHAYRTYHEPENEASLPLPPPPPPPKRPTDSPFLKRQAAKPKTLSTPARPGPKKALITPQMAKVAFDAGVCPSCGEVISPDWARCKHCNQGFLALRKSIDKAQGEENVPEASEASKELKCRKCGMDVEDGWIKCPDCGNDL